MTHSGKTLLLAFALIGILSINAKKNPTKELTAKVGGTNWKIDGKNVSAVWHNDERILAITAMNGNEKISIQLKYNSFYEGGAPKGSYFFGLKAIIMDDYWADAVYTKGSNEWANNNYENQTPGEVQIIEMTPTGVRGKFNFDLTRMKISNTDKDAFVYDKNDVVSITEGGFDLTLTTK